MKLLSVEHVRRFAATSAAASALVLSACATPPSATPVVAPPSFQSLMDSADAAQKQNLGAQAMALYEQAAKADPANKQPWLRMAQSYFDSRSYGQAITASQEALHRDNTDVTAKSLMAVSGLRVSADALDQLRQANAVGGSTRTEAQVLAKIMRDAVGEAIFPVARPATPPVVESPPPARRRAPAAAPAARPATPAVTTPVPATAATAATPSTAATPAAVAAPKPAPAAAPAAPAKPANPFDILKKN